MKVLRPQSKNTIDAENYLSIDNQQRIRKHTCSQSVGQVYRIGL